MSIKTNVKKKQTQFSSVYHPMEFAMEKKVPLLFFQFMLKHLRWHRKLIKKGSCATPVFFCACPL